MDSSFQKEDVHELRELLLRAKNLNSAVKSYLKNEVEKREEEIRFLKAVRKVALPTQRKQLERFLEQYGEEYTLSLFILVRHAYFSLLSPVVQRVIDEYAEQFNATYVTEGEDVRVTDEATFSNIIQAAAGMLDEALQQAGLGGSKMLHKVFVHLLYDGAVVKEAMPVHFQQVRPVAVGQ